MKTKIWAHRGASGHAPENTLAAFRLAADMQADGIELDVHFTRDGQVVVTHDDDVRRVTGHEGAVGSLTLAQLKRLDFSNHMAAFAGEKIPTFEEVLALVKPTRMMINIELKTNWETPNGLEEATHALVSQYGMEKRILYSSFNHDSLLHMKKVAPEIPCGLLYDNKVARPWDYANMLGMEALHPYFKSITQPDYMDICAEKGIQCNCWTVNEEKDIIRMLDAHVTGIITNYPALALKLREERQGA